MITKKRKKYNRTWYIKNKISILKECKAYYRKNRIAILKRVNKYRESHKEEHKLYLIRTKNKFLRKRQAYRKAYRAKNKNLRNKKEKLLRKNNKKIKILIYLRNRIWKVLKGNVKSARTIELLGCSIEFFRNYLEAQFKEGMNWNNYGHKGWVVDHILPCASFDLSKPEEQLKCFNYKNLQPLWESENLHKSNIIGG